MTSDKTTQKDNRRFRFQVPRSSRPSSPLIPRTSSVFAFGAQSKQSQTEPQRSLRYESTSRILPSETVKESMTKNIPTFNTPVFSSTFNENEFSNEKQKENLNQFEESLQTSTKDVTTTTEETLDNSFDAAILALKSSIIQAELGETNNDQFENQENYDSTLGTESFDLNNSDIPSKDEINMNSDNLFNAFQELFEDLEGRTEEPTEILTSVKPDLTDSEMVTEVSFVTGTEVSVNTEKGITNVESVDDPSNHLFETQVTDLEDFNLMESVTSSLMQDSLNMIVEKGTKILPEQSGDFTSEEISQDESTTVFPELSRESGRSLKDPFIGNEENIQANLELVLPKNNFATKTMSNGVEVIVAGDSQQASAAPADSSPDKLATDVTRKPFSGMAVTLPPSTLSGQVVLRASSDQEDLQTGGPSAQASDDFALTRTYYTTLTYLSTVMGGDSPFVVTSRETLSSLVTTVLPISGNFIERTQVVLNTETYYTTQTFTRTPDGEIDPITSHEVITQVIVTEAPSIIRTTAMMTQTASPMIVTKTYLTTFTFYKTGIINNVSQVETNTVVSSDVVTETVYITPKSAISEDLQTKTQPPSLDLVSDDTVYATRTFYTTSTHLTTLLEGTQTVTISSVEVQSRIVTETIPASKLLTMQNNILITPTSIIEDDVPQTEVYVPLGGHVYQRVKTYYATDTHFTTETDGSILSREVTRTNIETTTITTTDVPQNFISDATDEINASQPPATLKPSSVDASEIDPSGTLRKASISGSFPQSSFSGSVKPGRTSTKRIHGSSTRSGSVRPSSASGLKSTRISSLKASIVSSERSPGASVVQLDPSELISFKPIFTDSEVTSTRGLLDSSMTPIQSSTDDLSDLSLVSTSILTEPTVLIYSDGTSQSIDVGATVAVVESFGQRTVLPNVPKDLLQNTDTMSNVEHEEQTSKLEDGSSGLSPTGAAVGGGAAIGLMVPVLSAVAGMIRNNIGGPGVAALAKIDNEPEVDLPRHTLVRMEEPQFIPIGGVGFSMNEARRASARPTQGFIPLNRFEDENVVTQPIFMRPVTEVGQKMNEVVRNTAGFRPPTTTERGFTAIFTTGAEVPTRVSVISGVETILFKDGVSVNLPPPGLPPVPGGEFKLVQSSLDELDDMLNPAVEPIHVPNFPTEELPSIDNPDLNDEPNLIADGSRFFNTIVKLNDDNTPIRTELLSPDILDEYPDYGSDILYSTVGVGSSINSDYINTPLVVDNKETIVVNGVSTVMSGATTIFGSLFTRPSSVIDLVDKHTTILRPQKDDQHTRIISKIETVSKTLTETVTDVKVIEGVPSTFTEYIEKTLPPETVVSTVVGTETQINTVTVTSALTPAPTTSVASNTKIVIQHDESYSTTTEVDSMKISEGTTRTEATLDIAEENEISRVVKSQGPDQDISVRGPMALTACDGRCSEDKNEMCKEKMGRHMCVCRPGYARANLLNSCEPSMAFKIKLLLDSFSDNKIRFNKILKNMTHPTTQDLIDVTVFGVRRAFHDSDIANDFHSVTVTNFDNVQEGALPITATQVDGGVVAELKVEVAERTPLAVAGVVGGRRPAQVNERKVKKALDEALKNSNYSLGGTEVFASPYAAILESDDFDECSHPDHNDCSPNALCFNTKGSFSCVCRDGYIDDSPIPGRSCRERTQQCRRCNFNGECIMTVTGEEACECQPWFSGDQCQLNLRVLLVALVSVGGVLVLLLLLCSIFCCLKARKGRRAATQMLGSSTMGGASTLDRRAIVQDTSSEGSATPPMLFPRVKGPPYKKSSKVLVGHDTNSDLSMVAPQAALMDVIDGRKPRDNARISSSKKNSPSGGRISSRGRGDTADRYEDNKGRYRDFSNDSMHGSTQQMDERKNSQRNEIENISVHGRDTTRSKSSSYRYGGPERTISALRSCDETTVRPSMRSVPRPLSSQLLSEGGQTMAERDGGSTVVYPAQELYRPSMDLDSFSNASESVR